MNSPARGADLCAYRADLALPQRVRAGRPELPQDTGVDGAGARNPPGGAHLRGGPGLVLVFFVVMIIGVGGASARVTELHGMSPAVRRTPVRRTVWCDCNQARGEFPCPPSPRKTGREIFYNGLGQGEPSCSARLAAVGRRRDTQMLFFLNNGFRVIAHDRAAMALQPGGRRPRHGSLCRRSRDRDGPSGSEECRPRRPFHRRRRGGAYIARTARAGREGGVLSAVPPPLMVQTPAIRAACEISVRRLQVQLAANRSNSIARCRRVRSTATTGRGQAVGSGHPELWRQGMMGGAKAHYAASSPSRRPIYRRPQEITVPCW